MAENKDIKINKGQLTKAEGGNLTPFNSGDTEKEREIQRMGGKASVIAKRRKKTIDQYLSLILNHQVNQKELEALEQTGLLTPEGTTEDGEKPTKSMLIAMTLLRESMKGNMRAVGMLMSTQRAVEQKDESNTTNILEALKEAAEKDWETEKPIESPPDTNTSPVSNENA